MITMLEEGVLTVRAGSLFNYGKALAFTPDGELLLAGYSNGVSSTAMDFSVVRLQQHGGLDPRFAGTGAVLAPIGELQDRAYGIVVQPDGKVLVAGTISNKIADGEPDFAVLRLNADGSADNSFGLNGKAIHSIYQNTNTNGASDQARSIALQPDGKILVAGYSRVNGQQDAFSVIRLRPDGALDESFGTEGIFTLSLKPGSYDKATTVLVQPDGKILLTGSHFFVPFYGTYHAGVVRLNSDGTLDSSFAGTGMVSYQVGNGITTFTASAALLQPDGKILVVGNKALDKSDVSAIRLHGDGSLDTSFGTDGTQIITAPTLDYVNAVTLDAQGRIIMVGSIGSFASILRLAPDGSLDTSFGTEGKVVLSTLPYASQAFAVAIQDDGKIVVTGDYNRSPAQQLYDYLVVRLDADGKLDPQFTGYAARQEGTADDEVIVLAPGGAYIDGGAGEDTLALSLFPDTVRLQPGETTDEFLGFHGNDMLGLNSIEYLQFGSSFQTRIALADLVSGVAQTKLGQLTDLYLAFFGRAPDVAGLEYWQQRHLEIGDDFSDIASGFAWSEEAQALFPAGASNRDFVKTVYNNIFARDPEPAGWDYWTDMLNELGVNDFGGRGIFVAAVILGAYAPTSGPDDRDLLTHKHNVALHYVNRLSVSADEVYSPAIDALLALVNQQPQTQTSAKAVIDYAMDNTITLAGVMADPQLFDTLWGA